MKTQRTIKFRIWDEKYRCWVNNSFLLYPKEEIKIQGRILMQFTGLKDRIRKEIYEGDILQDSYSNYKVEFYRGCFWCVDISSDFTDKWTVFDCYNCDTEERPYLHSFYPEKTMKIIGNVFENLELLNEKV